MYSESHILICCAYFLFYLNTNLLLFKYSINKIDAFIHFACTRQQCGKIS